MKMHPCLKTKLFRLFEGKLLPQPPKHHKTTLMENSKEMVICKFFFQIIAKKLTLFIKTHTHNICLSLFFLIDK